MQARKTIVLLNANPSGSDEEWQGHSRAPTDLPIPPPAKKRRTAVKSEVSSIVIGQNRQTIRSREMMKEGLAAIGETHSKKVLEKGHKDMLEGVSEILANVLDMKKEVDNILILAMKYPPLEHHAAMSKAEVEMVHARAELMRELHSEIQGSMEKSFIKVRQSILKTCAVYEAVIADLVDEQ